MTSGCELQKKSYVSAAASHILEQLVLLQYIPKIMQKENKKPTITPKSGLVLVE